MLKPGLRVSDCVLPLLCVARRCAEVATNLRKPVEQLLPVLDSLALARSAACRVAATITRLHGTTPLLGRCRPLAAADREPVHAGRTSRPRRGGGRGGRVRPHSGAYRGARWCVSQD